MTFRQIITQYSRYKSPSLILCSTVVSNLQTAKPSTSWKYPLDNNLLVEVCQKKVTFKNYQKQLQTVHSGIKQYFLQKIHFFAERITFKSSAFLKFFEMNILFNCLRYITVSIYKFVHFDHLLTLRVCMQAVVKEQYR